MKANHIMGLLFTLLWIGYYISFADRVSSPDEQGSVTIGIGIIWVIALAFISAMIVVPSSWMLRRKKAREAHKFNGFIWNTLLVINSALAIFYSAIGIWIIGTFVWVWARS
ncbi:hypothetical protein HR45_00615 [Shewanella mangrovi]|uniref:Uncharacterized protein n=1 Tax=Shewanella mangrovi TaxID=1515746 RepID=A0A094K2Q0_9GAMM|nr:hypothetical protein [Shewanella mangrovi]KFZ38941.1 hypothetical protein HR45_00615 [Shewanella mangrovi]